MSTVSRGPGSHASVVSSKHDVTELRLNFNPCSTGPFTIFGPTDQAFQALGKNIVDFVANGFNSAVNDNVLTVSAMQLRHNPLSVLASSLPVK